MSSWGSSQVYFDGTIQGLAIALVAVGIVLIYRSSRVINFAVGNLGAMGAVVLALLTIQYGVPFWIALPACLVVGVLATVLIELTVVRRLFDAPRVVVLVATIGVAQLALAAAIALPDIDDVSAHYPVAVDSSWQILGVVVTGAQLTILVVVPALVAVLGWFLSRTHVGKAVHAAADNPELARLSGINPRRVSTLVWAIAGLLSTVSIVLMAGQAGSAGTVVTIGPDTLVRALAAAVIGGLTSFRRALVAAVVIGVAQSVIGFRFIDRPGLIDLLLLVAVLVAVYFQGRGETEQASFSFATRSRPLPERLRHVWWLRAMDRSGLVVLLAIGLVLPLLVTAPSRQILFTTILAYAICGASLTVLTGWAGQVSLGQMAFAGVSALLAATLTKGVVLNLGWGSHQLDLQVTSSFWGAIAIATVTAAGLAALMGAGSLRVRGLLLAVTTFAFALAAEQFLYRQPLLNGNSSGVAVFTRGSFLGIDMSSQRNYYYVVLAVLAVVLTMAARQRRTGVGRRIIAVRDNPDSAAAYTVSALPAKLWAFALAGGLAGLGGCLLAGALQQVPYSIQFFRVEDSLILVSLVVIGGLGTTTGPVLGALWVIGLSALAPNSELTLLLTSSVGLLVLLMFFPSGFAGMAARCRARVVEWAERRLPAEDPDPGPRASLSFSNNGVPVVPGDVLVLGDVSVAFGARRVLEGVDLTVGTNEVVGLIGANGAGKSTLMNAIGGFCPSTGQISFLGADVSGLSAGRRAGLGLGRTFQAARLFPELTVLETVEVALESRHRTGFISTSLWLPHAVRAERARRAEAAEILNYLGLGRYATTYISELSTGTRRVVELAGLLAMRARLMCLDEPTAGVAQRETESFGPLLLDIRQELGAAMLVIEHDMPFIMGISDRVYCLEAGRVISSGDPTAVRNDPRVVASYLGTDERAVIRSGALPPDEGRHRLTAATPN